MNRLMLCAGPTRRIGWKTLDANPECNPDVIASIPPLPSEVSRQLWNEIEWIHGITSFYPWDAKSLLEELRAILATDGKLVLEQPDFRKAVSREEWLFGDPTFRNPLHMNRYAYAPDTLTRLLTDAGFARIEILEAIHHNPSRDFRLEAYR